MDEKINFRTENSPTRRRRYVNGVAEVQLTCSTCGKDYSEFLLKGESVWGECSECGDNV